MIVLLRPDRRAPVVSALGCWWSASLLLLLSFFLCSHVDVTLGAVTSSSKTGSSGSSSTGGASGTQSDIKNKTISDLPFRLKNLDYWDVDTLAAYLSLSPIHPHDNVYESSTTTTTTTHNSPFSHSIYAGHDAVVLFYAQWDTNSHKFAPLWAQIAELKSAGTVESGVVMALFDCESKTSHKTICAAAGVTHYPTVMYVGRGSYYDTDPVTSAVLGKNKALNQKYTPFGKTTLPHTVKFQGDWRYGNQIMDFMDIMKKISAWNKWVEGGEINKHDDHGLFPKIMRSILRPFLPNKYDVAKKHAKQQAKQRGAEKEQIPVGVPPEVLMKQIVLSYSQSDASTATKQGGEDDTTTTSSPSLSETIAKAKRLEAQVKTLTDSNTKLKEATSHSSLLMDSFLFSPFVHDDPITRVSKPLDVFEYLQNTWDDYPNLGEILLDDPPPEKIKPLLVQSCVVDMSLDYCARFLIRNALDRYDAVAEANSTTTNTTNPTIGAIDARREPFCDILESCAKKTFDTDECRPQTCPFVSSHTNALSSNGHKGVNMACRYTNACLDQDVLKEYQNAVDKAMAKLDDSSGTTKSTAKKTTATTEDTTAASGATSTGTTATGKKPGGWGLK